MSTLSIDILFNAAVKIFFIEEHAISMTFTDKGIRIRFPTTRRLAEFLNVPHYYILPYFAMMEEQELVTREERVGIQTTNKGSMKIIRIIKEDFFEESVVLLGHEIFEQICKRAEI
jgi:Mn-dependent DtxR family transcriptional regulator